MSKRFFESLRLLLLCALWLALNSQPGAAQTAAPAQPTQPGDSPTIWLRGGAIDTGGVQAAGAGADLPAALRQARTAAPQFWLVQFAGPIQDAWLDRMQKLGLEIVAYMPDYAYVVWGDGVALDRLDEITPSAPFVHWTGPYHPAYRLAPVLRERIERAEAGDAAAEPALVDVTVQIYNTSALAGTLARLRALGREVYKGPSSLLNLTDIALALPIDQVAVVAAWPDVFDVEPWSPPNKLDEAQGQIVAGNLTTVAGKVVPGGPGYLAWLAARGFPTTPASYPVVDVVDDGLDQGNANNLLHPDFHELGLLANPDRVPYINNCTTDASGNGVAGHGNINAGIVAAYNNLSGSPYVDANGYRIGLGISPYGRVASTKVFKNNGDWSVWACGGTDEGVVAASYNAGATMTSNSWGDRNARGAYDASAQAYDALTRDASAATPGNQEMLHIFAAGNEGSGTNTLDSPGTAKNVLTVAATENVRDQGVSDGCNLSSANNADDIASFSSRGPTDDSRAKPDIAAPGTHVQGPASQDPGYDGSGVCGGSPNPPNKYYPSGQTLYTWSTGTSHSTPALAGAASLLYEYYGRVLNPGQAPSPAMLKALLINSARYLTGVSANDTLPSNTQGWGGVNLGLLFDDTQRVLLDQTVLFGASGENYEVTGVVADSAQPVRVSLVWTDAPGSTTGAAYVNDLDLEVTAGGSLYRGNVFSGAYSVAGGVADPRNNVENVSLPAGVSGEITVRVVARNIAGDGVPGNGDSTDQDFALVIYNAGAEPRPRLVSAEESWREVTGNGDGIADPGETLEVAFLLANQGQLAAIDVHGEIAVVDGAALLTDDTATYPDIPTGGSAVGQTPYQLSVDALQPCGAPLQLREVVTYNVDLTLTHSVTIPVGSTALGSVTNYAYNGGSVSIPDNNPAGATVAIDIATAGVIGDVDVSFSATHTWDADLDITLISPGGTSVELSTDNGGSGNNYTGAVFDDEATQAITAGSAPFTGRFQPESPLSALDGEPITGTWTLKVIDDAWWDSGAITGFALDIQPLETLCTPMPPVAPDLAIAQVGTSILLSWQHAAPNASYELWWSAAPYFEPGDAAATLLSTGGEPECTQADGLITCTDPGGTSADRFYAVRAANAAGAWIDSGHVGAFSFALAPGD